MGKSLVIVESPAKARTISRFLGKDFIVESSIGHIRDLPKSAKEVPAKIKKEPWGRLAIDIKIPISKQVPVALNEGVPIILSAPRNPVTRKIYELVERLAGQGVATTRPALRWSA